MNTTTKASRTHFTRDRRSIYYLKRTIIFLLFFRISGGGGSGIGVLFLSFSHEGFDFIPLVFVNNNSPVVVLGHGGHHMLKQLHSGNRHLSISSEDMFVQSESFAESRNVQIFRRIFKINHMTSEIRKNLERERSGCRERSFEECPAVINLLTGEGKKRGTQTVHLFVVQTREFPADTSFKQIINVEQNLSENSFSRFTGRGGGHEGGEVT